MAGADLVLGAAHVEVGLPPGFILEDQGARAVADGQRHLGQGAAGDAQMIKKAGVGHGSIRVLHDLYPDET